MSQKALFLDRDGVINVEKDYLYKIEEFEFIPGIFELCKHFQSLDYLIIVVTNQSGIARKMYTEADFSLLTFWMINAFETEGIRIDQVYHCPHHPDISGPCECRKPKPGMLLRAEKEFDIDMNNSVLVGDKERDIEAGLAAGIEKNFLFSKDKECSTKALEIVSNLEDIGKMIG